MIAKLTGIVDSLVEDGAVVDVGGVGYLVFCSRRTLARFPALGQPVSLLVETHVREDHIHLYGFVERAERDWFRLLTTVQGVGARMALSVLGVLSPIEIAQAIAAKDPVTLRRAPGVGPKLAQRMVSELADKAGETAFAGGPGIAPPGAPAGAEGPRGVAEDAISALVNLGYRRAEAFGAIAGASRALGPEAPLEALIRAGLKELSP
ncbi:MAG: Holliday junction branch migration protein RuvA [Proteobacteria bacterium]|nr:Holliday junction branch migration protein RuvA [Pseudomonadota bacterium]